jgi:hypothetical protein
MPIETKINMSSCLRSKYKESLHEMKGIIGSLGKMQMALGTGSAEMFTLLLKRFMFIICTVPDNYFLSDACENLHELFVEFRIMLGHFEAGESGNGRKKMERSFTDILEMSSDLYEMYRDFLSDPGYQGTNFPKSNKIRAMRDLSRILNDGQKLVHLSKNDPPSSSQSKHSKQQQQHVAIKMTPTSPKEEFDYTDPSKLPYPLNQPDHLLFPSRAKRTPSPADSGSSNDSESGLLRMPPKAPILGAKEISLAVPKEDSLIAAMNELMAPPVPPTSTHGKISYIESNEFNHNHNSSSNHLNYNYSKYNSNASSRRNSNSLRPPIIIDQDGDILPNGPMPQLRSAAASIYESSGGKILVNEQETEQEKLDAEFILAYREQACKPVEFWVETPKEMQKTPEELESSGWSSKSRSGY